MRGWCCQNRFRRGGDVMAKSGPGPEGISAGAEDRPGILDGKYYTLFHVCEMLRLVRSSAPVVACFGEWRFELSIGSQPSATGPKRRRE